MGQHLAFALATFLNDYDHVRSHESATTTFRLFPWTFENTTNVHSSSFELMTLALPISRLFVKASYRHLDFNLTKDPGRSDFQNGFYDANDTRCVAIITACCPLSRDVTCDVMLRHASSLTTADGRLACEPNPNRDFALIGRNLFDPRHSESTATNDPNDEVGGSSR